MTSYSTDFELPLAPLHPHNKIVVSEVTRVLLPPPLQADVESLQANVEYYYHRLSRLTFIAISINYLSPRHQITTLHVLSIIPAIIIASISTFHNSKLSPESPLISHFEPMV
ncbi:hypothetical protein A2U01_0052050, partial [Trifolium medium]|nr:hypothetical protein [Trifolium medium]